MNSISSADTGTYSETFWGNTGKNTVIEDLEDDVYEVSDSDFSKATARVFDKIDHGNYGVIPLSNCVAFIETLG